MANQQENQVKVSIVVPVYNVEKFLPACLDGICGQTMKEIEIICVDDQSTDRSYEILEEYARRDRRIRLFRQQNKGGGAARNLGFTKARGEYVLFLDSDDLFQPRLAEQAYALAKERDADIVVYDFLRFDENGNKKHMKSLRPNRVPKNAETFSYRDCPDAIMSLVNPVPWNKMFRTEFIARNQFKYEEISSTNDVTFATVTVAAAERIAYLEECLVHYRIGHSNTVSSTKTKNLNNVYIAVESGVRQALALPHGDLIRKSVQQFAIEKYVFSLRSYVVDFSSDVAKDFYEKVHASLRAPLFDGVTPETFSDRKMGIYAQILQHNNHAELYERSRKKLIVSITSYPGRMSTIHQVISSVTAQTRKADLVLLWLAKEQFSGLEADLPAALMQQVEKGQVEIRWCDEDLRSHKKYFYAMQEFPRDLIVTLDDDLLYSNMLLNNLWEAYLCWPQAVTTIRTHLMAVTQQGEIGPYDDWIKETDGCMNEPCMQLMATTGAGTLHPAELFPAETFDKEAIRENCFFADDVWLKMIEMAAGIPVVCCQPNQRLRYVPGTQDDMLFNFNVLQHQNDVQLQKTLTWLEERHGKGHIARQLCNAELGKQYVFNADQLAFIRRAVENAKRRGGGGTRVVAAERSFIPMPKRGPFKMLRKKLGTAINSLLTGGWDGLRMAYQHRSGKWSE